MSLTSRPSSSHMTSSLSTIHPTFPLHQASRFFRGLLHRARGRSADSPQASSDSTTSKAAPATASQKPPLPPKPLHLSQRSPTTSSPSSIEAKACTAPLLEQGPRPGAPSAASRPASHGKRPTPLPRSNVTPAAPIKPPRLKRAASPRNPLPSAGVSPDAPKAPPRLKPAASLHEKTMADVTPLISQTASATQAPISGDAPGPTTVTRDGTLAGIRKLEDTQPTRSQRVKARLASAVPRPLRRAWNAVSTCIHGAAATLRRLIRPAHP